MTEPIRYGKLKKTYLALITDFFDTFEICFTATGLLVTKDPLTDEPLRIDREQVHAVLQEDKRMRGFSCTRVSLTQHIDHVIDTCLERVRSDSRFKRIDLSTLRRIEL